MEDKVVAIVEKVITEGKHGPYVVTRTLEDVRRNVTFSLQSPTWKAKCLPGRGSFVVLSTLSQKRAGWRAGSARFTKPSEIPVEYQQTAMSKEQ